MAEPAAGITRATSFGEREPPTSRSRSKAKARARGVPPSAIAEVPSPADHPETDEVKKHELDTMA
jgi:hypothetical protein